MSSFIKKTLENNTSANIQNSAQETIGRVLGTDEVIAFALYMERDIRYKWLKIEGSGDVIRINPNYEIELMQNEKLKYDLKIAKRIVKTYTLTQIIAWISFFVALFLGWLQLAQVLKLWPYHK